MTSKVDISLEEVIEMKKAVVEEFEKSIYSNFSDYILNEVRDFKVNYHIKTKYSDETIDKSDLKSD